MSLEHALLDRLEKRSLQIAQQKNEIYGLRQLVNEKMAINEQLAAEVIRERETARANYEHMERQIAGLHGECEQLRREVPLESTREALKNAVAKLQEVTTERDRILEASRSLVPKSALKQAVQEAAELHGALNDAQGEIQNLRAEVPLESTREALKNAVAKLQEVNAQLDSAKGEAEEWLKQCHAARRQRDEVKAEARKETQRLSDLCAELQGKHESLLAKTTDLGSYAMTLGRKEGEPLEMFMERQALRLAALESTITAKCDELAKETAKIKPLEALYKTLKGWQENDHIIGYGLTIDTAINKATEALSQLTA